MNDYLPRVVRIEADKVHAAVGLTPAVERDGDSWTLIVASDRVTATATYQRKGKGHVKWVNGSLTVDGEDRPLARTYNQLARILHDPDRAQRAVTASSPPLPPLITPADAPPLVSSHYHQTVTAIGGRAEIRLHGTRNRWIIALTSPRATLRVHYRRIRRGSPIGYDPRQPFHIIINGEDRTDEAAGDLTRAIRLASAALRTPADNVAPSGAPAAAARCNSVEIRRHSVMRN